MSARAFRATAFLAAVGMSVSGCGAQEPSRRKEVNANLETINREHATDKLVARGRAFVAVGDYTRAEEYFASAINQGADDKKLMPLILDACIQDGRLRLAAQYANDHLRKHPGETRIRLVLAMIYVGLSDADLAEKELRRVLEEKPEDAQAHFALATILREKNDPVAADHHYREYLRIEPQGQNAEEARGHLLQKVP